MLLRALAIVVNCFTRGTVNFVDFADHNANVDYCIQSQSNISATLLNDNDIYIIQ
jgi:hypothetical protein